MGKERLKRPEGDKGKRYRADEGGRVKGEEQVERIKVGGR